MAAARAEFAPKEREIEVGGVPCLEVTGDTPTGTIVYFFGGGHTVGSPEEDIVIGTDGGRRWRTGDRRAVSVGARQPYPAAVDSAEAAYRGVLDEIGDGPVVVAGESAGGNLALTHAADRDADSALMRLRCRHGATAAPGATVTRRTAPDPRARQR